MPNANTITWRTETRKLTELKPAAYNPRKIDDQNRTGLAGSLDKYGQAMPIVINQDGTVVNGHQRIAVLKAQGVEDVSVSIPDRQLTPEEEKGLNLEINRWSGQFTEDGLRGLGMDTLSKSGWTAEEISVLFAKKEAQLKEQTLQVKAFKYTHALVSVPPDAFRQLSEYLEAIKTEIPDAQIETSAN